MVFKFLLRALHSQTLFKVMSRFNRSIEIFVTKNLKLLQGTL